MAGPPEAPEQEVAMSASIDTMHGVGEAALEVFRLAGFKTIMQLKAFDVEDRKLKSAIAQIKTRPELDHRPSSYWQALGTRCVNIIYCAKSAQATPYVPDEYMCPITLQWFDDPVVAPSGHSFSRAALLESLASDPRNPITREPLSIEQAGKLLYTNFSLRHAVEHYRLNHQRFSILD